MPLPGGARRYVRGWQFRPGTPAVHHANLRLDTTPASRKLDDADPAAGYEGAILRSADFPDGHFLGWTPGQTLAGLDDATAWAVEPDTDFVVQLHLRPTGKEEVIAPAIGLDSRHQPNPPCCRMIRLGRQQLRIPAGIAANRLLDAFELPVDIEATRGAGRMRITARGRCTPGRRCRMDRGASCCASTTGIQPGRSAINIARRSCCLPAPRFSSINALRQHPANTRNPQLPPQAAEWGWRSNDEMGDVWLQVTTASARDRDALARAARRKMQAEDAIGSEVLIAREPDRVDLRNDAGTIYMSLDQPSDALRHFTAAARLHPSASLIVQRPAVALEATGDRCSAPSGGYRRRHHARSEPLGRAQQLRQPDDARRPHRGGARRVRAGRECQSKDNAEARANLA